LTIVRKTVDGVINASSEAIECYLQAGFSIGTDCPMVIASGVIDVTGEIANGVTEAVIYSIKEAADYLMESLNDYLEARSEYVGEKREIYQSLRDIDDLITQFQTLSQEIFGMQLAIEDLKYQIGANYATYQDDVRFALDHIVGRENGNLLRGRRLVTESDQKFRKLLQYTYRMLMAFQHDYNLTSAQLANYKNRLMASVTLDDVRDLIEDLEQYELDYCGREGLDCDNVNNVEMLRLSLRDTLFPKFTDKIGPDNRVITKGELFHNQITNLPQLRRVIINGLPAQVIELPFQTPLTLQSSGINGPQWLISPLECNHHLVNKRFQGNVAVNFKGKNLGEGERSISYELIRGHTDFMRSCHPETRVAEVGLPPETTFPIRSLIVGYAPQSSQAQSDSPLSFVTNSSNLSGCINGNEARGELNESECWRFFARGRSLSAPDWRIVIPVTIDGAETENAWIMGEGLPSDERPIIEDIVIYLRYQSRPTSRQ
jgi:hypothetical protein